ncbi:acyl-CoA synthetase [Dietzia sp. HMSC21D01]|uniref:AMP-binding protein n=1 Tax=Dietzia cinnamea TaxID=321318 RepID=A0AAW5Q591_9ACTN|nr:MULTISPECIES: AMP-binding protein [Dietzia]MCT1863214.1 AMP-binding protein [Dietzia cinnamea]MCT2031104.1 AMP-binding protein [Dietzia cinnamea]MCT2032579.1 AMP-binding protein [Dietzia cinnamea]MCT2075416.1 AMP-binding protein [Dietzia cinnamea]MCT2105674.1 AMP-binding protein [Dietzia cinnamea]
MSGAVKTIAEVAAQPFTSVADAVHALRAVGDRGIWSDGRLTPWSDAVGAVAVRIAALRELMTSSSPPSSSSPSSSSPSRPHIGLLLAGTPEYLHLLGAAACSELVVAGLNPTRRGEALIRDAALADCALILTDADNAALLDGLDPGVPVVSVDSPEWTALLERHADAALPEVADVPVGPDDLVALVFTSGTSGDPKAVRITQNKISVPGRMLAERFGIGRDDCVYSAMPLFHSNAVMVAWPIALYSGCSIALRRRFSASNWLDDVRRHGCTFANYVGAPLSYILATPERPDDADNPMRVAYGNEAPADVRREFARRFGVTVVDGFGSSEGGISVTRTPGTPDAALGPLPDGVRIVDPETGDECPRARFDDAGVLLNADASVGEMVADGPGLFSGYYGDPAADAERMRGGRFHSGDLAYVDDEGWVYFAGRSGGWMRVDGENLAAAPIERVLRRHPDVAEVGVYAVPAETVRGPAVIGDAVAAAVVPREGADASALADGFGDFLAAQSDLGPKQWPSLLRMTAALPRTASFKFRARDLSSLGAESAGDRVWVRADGAGAFTPE